MPTWSTTIIENKVVQHALTIPEGLTSEQIVAKLLENDALSGQIKEIPREGTLLPETYKFTRGMPREQIIQRMQQAHRHLLQEVWEHRLPDLPVKTPEQLVTLASIVEKETGKAGRALARCLGVRQSAQEQDASCNPIRPSFTA